MDVFALLSILSFIALLVTLVVMNLYKKWKMKSKVAKGSKHIGWEEKCVRDRMNALESHLKLESV